MLTTPGTGSGHVHAHPETTRFPRLTFVTLMAGALLSSSVAPPAVDAQADPPTDAEAAQFATDAYGDPFVTMEYTRRS